MTCKWLDVEPQTTEIPYDSRTMGLIECLIEDPEDNPAGFIPIIKLHIARLEKVQLLCAATSAIIQKKWEGGTDLADIGKFLQAGAPEPYTDKPMPRGMIQALLGTAPNTQDWSPADLLDYIFRNAEATDTEEDLVRTLKSLGTSGGSTVQEPFKKTLGAEPGFVRIFHRMRSLHDTRRDWLALNTNIGSWIQNLERRDMLLVGSMVENIFGFSGTHARKKQASLAPILTRWKRWVELNATIDNKNPRTGWILNLGISGSIATNKVEKVVSWNVGPHGYKGSKEEVHKIFEQGPPIIYLQDV